jgi:hypothetical protein
VLPSDEEILAAIVALVDDGFAPRRDLLLERKDADGRGFVALSGEGSELLRTARARSIQPVEPGPAAD